MNRGKELIYSLITKGESKMKVQMTLEMNNSEYQTVKKMVREIEALGETMTFKRPEAVSGVTNIKIKNKLFFILGKMKLSEKRFKVEVEYEITDLGFDLFSSEMLNVISDVRSIAAIGQGLVKRQAHLKQKVENIYAEGKYKETSEMYDVNGEPIPNEYVVERNYNGEKWVRVE